MRAATFAILAAGVLAGGSASAQFDGTSSFRGLRAEVNGGGERYYALGQHHSKVGYGGTIGFDGILGDKLVIGPEATYWRPDGGTQLCAGSGNAGVLCSRSSYELGTAVRAGFLITPQLLIFGKGGYVNVRQRVQFASPTSLIYVNGQILPATPSSNVRSSVGGYQFGGGAEYSLSDMFYVDAQYVYSNYAGSTLRQRVMVGAGVRFK